MQVEQIDLLVVGLPVSTFLSKRDVLRNLLLGEHQIANRNVLVRDVLVLSQPHGALGTYGLANGMFKRIRKQTSLIIDCGARTFDWLVAKGFQTVEQRSRAVNRGMLDVLEAIAEQIEVELGVPLRDLDKIDRALRFNSAPVIMQRRIELQPYMARATAIARDAVHALRRRVDDELVLRRRLGRRDDPRPPRRGGLAAGALRRERHDIGQRPRRVDRRAAGRDPGGGEGEQAQAGRGKHGARA